VRKGRGFDTKLIQTGTKKAPNATKMEPKGSQNEPRNLQIHPLRSRIEKVRKTELNVIPASKLFGTIFDQKSIKTPSKKSSTNQSPKNMKINTKRLPK
jgi:hypothetical protein